MTFEEFEKKLQHDRYQLFLFCSPLKLPLSFAVHTWFVAVEHGVATRWEILFEYEYSSPSWGHLHKNAHAPHEGISLTHYVSSRWPSKLLATWEGGAGSPIEHIVRLLNTEVHDVYPFTHRYTLPGPNSNTFTQWVLSQAHGIDFRLPRNAFGCGWQWDECLVPFRSPNGTA